MQKNQITTIREYLEVLKNERTGSGEKDDVREFGFYWLYKGIMFFNNRYGKDGFSKREVENISNQVLRASRLSRELIKEQHFLARLDGVESYVYINDMGDIFLPELASKIDGRVYGKIKNPKKIKNFKTSEEWYAKK